jgi:hypothetical protein
MPPNNRHAPSLPATDPLAALFDDYTPDQARKDAQETKDAAGSGVLRKFPVGKSVVRLGPARPGSKVWVPHWKHMIPLGGDKNAIFPCARMHAKRACRGCATAARLAASKNTLDQEAAKRAEAERGALCNMLVRELGGVVSETPAFRPAELRGKLLEDIQQLINPDGIGATHAVHPRSGVDVIVVRTGSGRNDTRYSVHLDPHGPRPLADTDEEMALLLQGMHNLEALIQIPSDEEVEGLLRGLNPADARRLAASSGSRVEDRMAAPAARPALPQTHRAPAVRQPEYDDDGNLISGTDDDIPF